MKNEGTGTEQGSSRSRFVKRYWGPGSRLDEIKARRQELEGRGGAIPEWEEDLGGESREDRQAEHSASKAERG